jgi:hypothetical protein
VRLHALLLVMPDRSNHQLVFGDPEGPLGIRQLDVMLPQRGRVAVV